MSATRVALVTGANRGIGFEVCRQLAQRGLRVVVTARDGGKAEKAAAALRGDAAVRDGVVAEVLDVSDEGSVRALARMLAARKMNVDVLVNNAAILVAESQRVLQTPIDDVRATFETNVFGAIAVSQAFVPGCSSGATDASSTCRRRRASSRRWGRTRRPIRCRRRR